MKVVSPFIATIILVISTISIGIVVYMHWSGIIKSIVEKEDVNCFGAEFKIVNFYSPKTEFKYSREILINNTVNFELKDYQVRIVIDTQNLISNNYLKSDCSDIRFLDSDKKTLLNYWIESGCNTQNTTIWVKVPSILPNSVKTVYFVSGNENLNSLSNKDSVFPLFDFYPNYPNWSDNRTYVCGNQGMMGGYNNFGSGAYTQKTINLDPGTYIISFIFIKGDSWDGEYGRLFLNNNLVWQKQYSYFQGSQICGGSSSGWNELFDFINVTFTHNGGSLTIKFDSTLNQAANDEWWGVDRIVIRKYAPSEPIINLGKELGSIVIKSNTYSFNLYFTGKSSSSLGSKYIATLYLANNTVIQKEIDIGCNLGSKCKISKIINLESDIDIEKIEVCSKTCSYICAKYRIS
jgi:hypothetical protein